jgi:hypothetical protein
MSAAGRIARQQQPSATEAVHAQTTAQVRARMVDRVWFVGVNATTAPQIEASFERAIDLLERHLANRPYLFGRRPAFGDFGVWAQLYCAWTDPTAGALIEGRAPTLLAWIQRMLWPHADGAFESWSALAPTLNPLLESEVGRLFLPWSVANAQAITRDDETFSVPLADNTWTQKPQKYHARSLVALRDKYAKAADKGALDAALATVGCLALLRG